MIDGDARRRVVLGPALASAGKPHLVAVPVARPALPARSRPAPVFGARRGMVGQQQFRQHLDGGQNPGIGPVRGDDHALLGLPVAGGGEPPFGGPVFITDVDATDPAHRDRRHVGAVAQGRDLDAGFEGRVVDGGHTGGGPAPRIVRDLHARHRDFLPVDGQDDIIGAVHTCVLTSGRHRAPRFASRLRGTHNNASGTVILEFQTRFCEPPLTLKEARGVSPPLPGKISKPWRSGWPPPDLGRRSTYSPSHPTTRR